MLRRVKMRASERADAAAAAATTDARFRSRDGRFLANEISGD
jgi:hypothetical protein